MKVCETCGARYDGAIERCPLDRGRLLAADDPLVGASFAGAYRVLSAIGRGALATVYRARHEVLGREVALKVLSPAVARSPVLRERFLREARAMHRIRHPHVVAIDDVGESPDGVPYIVMELAPGETLAHAIARGPLPPARALAIAAQLASALDAAHALGVVHRDVKPANVILPRGEAEPFAKLVDFGLANVRGEAGLTATGEVFGTPAYMAPEQIEGAPASPAIDLYALGCVLYAMLAGRPPFEGPTAVVLEKHASEAPAAPSSLVPGLDPRVDAIVLGLLAKEPSARAAGRDALLELASSPVASGPSTWDALAGLRDRIDALLARREGIAARALADELAALARASAELASAARRGS